MKIKMTYEDRKAKIINLETNPNTPLNLDSLSKSHRAYVEDLFEIYEKNMVILDSKYKNRMSEGQLEINLMMVKRAEKN